MRLSLARSALPLALVFLALPLCRPALAKQILGHFNGTAAVDVNDFATSADRLATADSTAHLGPPGSGFPGDGPQGRALDAGVTGTAPQSLSVPLDKTADFSQGTFECWVKTAWDWTEQDQRNFIGFRMEGGNWNSINLYYHGRMGAAQVLAFNINDGVDHCITYDGHKLGWKRGEWHHIAASWTQHSSWLFADGKLVATAAYAEPMTFTPPRTPLQIGETGMYGAPCGALIDEVRVCDEALYVGCDSIPLAKAPLPDRLPARLSDGAEVTASSTAPSIERAEDVPELHDGLYGKAVLVGRTPSTGEVLVTLKEPKRISGVRWSRDGRPLIDRGTEQEAGWARASDVPSDYVIEASADGKTWVELARRTDFFIGPAQLSEAGIRILHTFEPLTATKVRMRITKGLPAGLGGDPMLDEFEVLEAGTGANLARDAVVSTGRSIFRRNYSAAHLVDGKVGEENSWKAGAPGPATVTLTLRKDAEVHALEWSRSAEKLQTEGTPAEMIVEGLVGGEWVELAHVTGNTQAARQRTALTPTVTRQVRLRILSTVDGKEATLDEVALY
jgi:hypothetical protein